MTQKEYVEKLIEAYARAQKNKRKILNTLKDVDEVINEVKTELYKFGVYLED